MPELNSTYFQTVCSKTEDNTTYKIIRPLGNPIILFSEVDGSPLASFHLKCTDSNVQSVLTKRPQSLNSTNTDFQGIINKDDQPIEFVMSNLTPRCLNYTILKNDSTPVNKVNMVRPFSSYSVKCDRDNSMNLVLKASKDTTTGETVTVKESETNKTHEQLGTYLTLRIIPEDIPLLVKQFGKTVWKCVDLFCLEETIKQNTWKQLSDLELRSSDSIPRSSTEERCVSSNSNRTNFYETIPKGIPILSSGDMRCSEYAKSGHMKARKECRRIVVKTPIDGTPIGTTKQNITYDLRGTSSNPHLGVNTLGVTNTSQSSCDPKFTVVPFLSGNIDEETSAEIVNKSKIAQIGSGTTKITEQTEKIDINLNYKAQGTQCKIGLSVDEDLVVIIQEPSLFEEKANEMMDEIMKNISDKVQVLLSKISKVYNSESCVICLDEDIAPNMVIYQCGHQCCHYECGEKLKTCPLCRMVVSAHIKIRPN